jgi:hypothetical protein
MAGLFAPVEAIKRSVGLGEGYNYAKARKDQILSDARRNTGTLGTVTEMAGGGEAGAGLARGGITVARLLSSQPGIVGRTLSSAAVAAGFGGIAGFNEGNSLQDRAANAGQGVLTGALIRLAASAALMSARISIGKQRPDARRFPTPTIMVTGAHEIRRTEPLH